MSFSVVTSGVYADVLCDGNNYRVSCRRCGSFRESTDRGQSMNEAAYHNAPGFDCRPRSHRPA